MSVWMAVWYVIAIAVVPRKDPPDTSAEAAASEWLAGYCRDGRR